jgi:hypothetical protein
MLRILGFLSGLLDVALWFLNKFREEEIRQQGRNQVVIGAYERDRKEGHHAEEVRSEVYRTPLSDLERRMRRYKRASG